MSDKATASRTTIVAHVLRVKRAVPFSTHRSEARLGFTRAISICNISVEEGGVSFPSFSCSSYFRVLSGENEGNAKRGKGPYVIIEPFLVEDELKPSINNTMAGRVLKIYEI